MGSGLCLLTVHAHPDDESSKGPATVARYHAEGIRTVLVCCTGGEEGDILNPAADTPETRKNIGEVRRRELAEAAAVIGYDRVVHLGYRDSGMAGSPSNSHPECFAMASTDEAVGRLVAVIREEKPQVIVTYGEDHGGYPHPDHVRTHEVTVSAFQAAGDPDSYPHAGEPFRPLKLYYISWSGQRIMDMHLKFLELGLESPFNETWLERAGRPQAFTTVVDVSDYTDVRREALLAHATQIDPSSPFWFGLPPEVARGVHPVDEYLLSDLSVVGPVAPGGASEALEDDLFAGLR